MADEPRTSLRSLAQLGVQLGVPRLYAKCESESPTGTQKDRVAGGLVRAAVAGGAPGITVGTCGNLGVAISYASRAHGLACEVFVPASYHHTRADEMAALGARVVAVGACYEDAVEASQAHARARGLFDANPVGRGGEIAILEYGAIIDELVVQCPARLGSIWVPVGNGTCAAGIHTGLQRHGIAARVCVVGSAGNTALTASLAAGRVVELDPAALRETTTNEPLVNWRSLHVLEAMEAVQRTSGFAHDATDAELIAARDRLLAAAQQPATPSGAAGLAGLQAFVAALDPAQAHVVILTA
ncbi:MAG TPA: pyridoxal-phosphate dependent enzyme [Kofleriaceae bacterium]|nr:pyridoxal-phosphate dependent enzyme [Kofleriaceae bacterium]